MSERQLTIELEPGPWEGEEYRGCWPVGGKITGTVRFLAPETINARKVRVDLQWHTEGRGDQDKKEVAFVDLHEGELRADREYAWPFELRVPDDGPISYAGHYIEIIWLVRARVDIPWGRDVKAEERIQILPDYDLAETH